MHNRGSPFSDVFTRISLDGSGDYLFSLSIGNLLGFILDLLYTLCSLVPGLALHGGNQHLFCLFRGYPGYIFQFLPLLLYQGCILILFLLDLGLGLSQVLLFFHYLVFPFFNKFLFLIQVFFLVYEPPLYTLKLLSLFLALLLKICPCLIKIVLRLEKGLLLCSLGLPFCIIQDLFRKFFVCLDLGARNKLLQKETSSETCQDGYYCRQY